MAIVLDAVSAGNTDNDSSSFTVAHTCVADANYLIASCTSNGSEISGVTYNGVAMSLIATHQNSVSNRRAYMWGLVSPATGASYNCVASYVTSGTSAPRLTVISFMGVDTANPVDVSGTAEGLSGTVTKSVTTTVANGMLIDSILADSSPTVDGAQTQRSNQGSGAFGYNGTSTKATTTTGSYSMSWTLSSDRWETVVAHLKAGAVTFSVIDTTTVSEPSITSLITRMFSILETTTMTDVISFVKSGVFTILDSFSLSDSLSFLRIWPRQTKNTATLSNQTKHTATGATQTKNTATLTNQTKNGDNLI